MSADGPDGDGGADEAGQRGDAAGSTGDVAGSTGDVGGEPGQPGDEASEPGAGGAASTDGPAGSGPAVLLALVIFGASLVGYPVALVVGADVTWAVGSNAAATVALVGWTARRTFVDPRSSVTTVPGAIGTSLLVLGCYGLVVAGVLALTGRWHDAGSLVVPVALSGATALVLGFATFAFEAVFQPSGPDRDESGDGEARPADEGE